jgi:Tol biopolymer transport system component
VSSREVFAKKCRNQGVQRDGGKNSPLLPRSSAPLLVIVALAWLVALTACTASSVALEPAVPASTPAKTATPIPSPQVPTALNTAQAQLSTTSPDFPTPTFSPEPTSTDTPEPPPTLTATPTLTPSPAPGSSLRQLTNGGCCVQPSFSPDSQQVLFIDKPGDDVPVGIYGVDIKAPRPVPVLVNNIIGFWNFQRTIVATIKGDLAVFTNVASGESWTVNTGGNWPSFSPDSNQIIWVATDREGPYDRRQNDIWLANLDGSNARKLLSLYGGGLTGWFPDSQRILLTGRDNPNEEKLTLFVYDLANERRTNLFSHKRLRGGEISTGGSWIAFFISFADDPAENGLWVIRSDGANQQRLDIPRFGAYTWRNDDTMLYIPMRAPSEESMQVWAIAAATGQLQPLTDPATLPFSISNGDWETSPDGQYLAFVNSADQNIWLITLP